MSTKFDLEISGKIKSTTSGNVDWYYGGGNEYYQDKPSAYSSVSENFRLGTTVGILEGGKIVEYHWDDPTNLTNSGLVLKFESGDVSLDGDNWVAQFETNLNS